MHNLRPNAEMVSITNGHLLSIGSICGLESTRQTTLLSLTMRSTRDGFGWGGGRHTQQREKLCISCKEVQNGKRKGGEGGKGGSNDSASLPLPLSISPLAFPISRPFTLVSLTALTSSFYFLLSFSLLSPPSLSSPPLSHTRQCNGSLF